MFQKNTINVCQLEQGKMWKMQSVYIFCKRMWLSVLITEYFHLSLLCMDGGKVLELWFFFFSSSVLSADVFKDKSHVMYEGKHIHFSEVDNKPLCSYSPKLCKQRRLNGYAFCIRHVLEDKTAPFKQCEYVAKYNSQRCTNPIPKSEDRRWVLNECTCGTCDSVLYIKIAFFFWWVSGGCVLIYQILQQPPAGSRFYPEEGAQEEARCFRGNASSGSPGVSGSQHNGALFSSESH